MQMQLRQMQIRQMHNFIFVLVGVLILFAITFVSAYVRVGQSEKFTGIPLKSLKLQSYWEIKPVK